MEALQPTPRTTLKRLPKRASYDRAVIDSILDQALVCHVGFESERQPYVIPTLVVRIGDRVFFHGSAASRMLRTAADGVPVCLTVTHLDGLVLARSAFHHSVNYRSVMVFGRAIEVTGDLEKIAAMRAMVDKVCPGQRNAARPPTPQELKATSVLSLPIDEASAKVRTGGPLDDEEDQRLNVWAGVLPLRMVAGEPIADPRLRDGISQSRRTSWSISLRGRATIGMPTPEVRIRSVGPAVRFRLETDGRDPSNAKRVLRTSKG